MPKLNLKETPSEAREREYRELKKSVRKSMRYWEPDDTPSRASSSRKPPSKPPTIHAKHYDYVFDEGDLPPPSSHKPDTDYQTQLNDEDEFRAKLFDAMDMDMGQDSAQARFNDYVPPRWRSTSTAPDDDPLVVDPQMMSEAEYAEYIRRGMWERTHKAEHEARQRKKEAAEERKRRKKELKEKTKLLEEEEKERRRRKKAEKEQANFLSTWNSYEARWAVLQKAAAASTLAPESLGFPDIPWPTLSDTVDKESIAAFLLDERLPGDKPRKQRLRDAFLLYHPDRFESKIMPAVRDADRERVKEAVGHVIRVLNALAEEKEKESS